MTNYYKATRPDGTDFRTGTIDYANALRTGKVIEHPFSKRMVPNEPSTYLSVSVTPAETLIGGKWPCRLFRVEPIGETLDGLEANEHKRACLSLRVIEELPAWQALGPNGERVVAVISRAGSLTAQEADGLYAARHAARDAARHAARDAARYAAWDAAWDAAWYAARYAARDAAIAEVVRDLITEEQYQTLVGPWLSVIGNGS